VELGKDRLRRVDVIEKLARAVPGDTTEVGESAHSGKFLFERVLPVVQRRCLVICGETVSRRIVEVSRYTEQPRQAGFVRSVAQAGVDCSEEYVTVLVGLDNRERARPGAPVTPRKR